MLELTLVKSMIRMKHMVKEYTLIDSVSYGEELFSRTKQKDSATAPTKTKVSLFLAR